MNTPSIYALLVGIDTYQPPVTALKGAVNDMRAMRDFLQQRATETGTPLLMEILENEQATRQNIVSGFKTHLTKASADDTVFFYYSGHGSQQIADQAFWGLEEDKKLETLICYDSEPDGFQLADKEIANLLGQVAKKTENILVIMDCCNSGSATRSETTRVRSVSINDLPQRVRPAESFIMPLNSGSAQEARHVALFAAQSFQKAKEDIIGGAYRGIFTYSLLEVLATAVGPLTYTDLMRRVRNLVMQRTYDQVPQLYALESGDPGRVFLNGAVSRSSNYFALTHDAKLGWVIDAGSIHGIPDQNLSAAPAIIAIFAEDAPETELRDMNKALGKATVTEVRPDISLLKPADGLFLDTATAYRARIFSLPIKTLGVHIRGDVAQGIALAKTALANDTQASLYVKAVDTPAEAAYNLIAGSDAFPDQYYITRKLDPDSQPLVEQIPGIQAASAQKVVDQLFHIAKWERLLERRNPNSNIPSEGVKVDIYHATENQIVAPEQGGIIFRYKQAEGRQAFRIKITNRSGRRLYCSLLYLSPEYEVKADILPQKQGGVWLDPDQEAWANDGRPIKPGVPDAFYQMGKKAVVLTFKAISSTKWFDASPLAMTPLGLPRPSLRSESAADFGDADYSSDDWNATETAVTVERID
ncbi:MAG: caspase family protein [Bacteroidetes bacterium]|nr:MAG: caspase family protein [Bacteroidota bacterium]